MRPSLPRPPRDDIAAIPTAQIAAAIAVRAAEIAALTARLLTEPSVVAAHDHGKNGKVPDETLSAEEIATALHHSKRWLYRSAHRLPFLRRVGRTLIASRHDLEAWRTQQRIR